MDTTNILYIGRHIGILSIVVRLLNSNQVWNAVGVMNDEEAKVVFCQKKFRIVLLGSGIQKSSEATLCAFFKKQRPDIIIVQHYGGGSGLLKSEILLALETDK